MKNWTVVTGGAGYIGSHICSALKDDANQSVLLIDLHGKNRPQATDHCDIFADEDFGSQLVHQTIMNTKPSTVIHCAEDNTADLSLIDPLAVWQNNAAKTVSFLKTCIFAGVQNFIFLSSSNIYPGGKTAHQEIDRVWPIDCLARNKLMIEQMLKDCYYSHSLNSVSLRIPVVGGCDFIKNVGPLPTSKNVLHSLLNKILIDKPFEIYGKDYNTEDGTPLRNFIHVFDVVDAVKLSINYMKSNNGCSVFNLSSVHNITVEQLVGHTKKVIQREIDYLYVGREPAKPGVLLLDSSEISKTLQWQPKHNLESIIDSTWQWYQTGTYAELCGLVT